DGAGCARATGKTARGTTSRGANGSPRRNMAARRAWTAGGNRLGAPRAARRRAPAIRTCVLLAPRPGFEPGTYRLTAGRSTVELSRNATPTLAIDHGRRNPGAGPAKLPYNALPHAAGLEPSLVCPFSTV